MTQRLSIFVAFAFAALVGLLLLTPPSLAQKPTPPPTPPPTSPLPPTSGQPGNPATSSTQPVQPDEDFVMYLMGRVATDDGSNLPTNVMIERVCNARVRQQVYASPAGDFSMQLGSMIDSALDASADASSQSVLPNKFADTGIPRRDLEGCEVRASISGFQSRSVSIMELDSAGTKSIEVGTIVVHRSAKVEGTTLDAAAYRAPKDALSAYEKGIQAEKSNKLESAQRHFEKAVEIYPKYARAWFELGTILQKQNQKEAARTAYTKATTSDARFLPPYLSLAVMAYQAADWNQVLRFTNSILDLDPFRNITGYTVELDPFSYGEAYFYHALANYNLEKLADAERSALKAEHLLTRFPQVHLLLGEIFARKKNYDSAISELRMYLDLDPHAKNADEARQHLAELEKQNGSFSNNGKADPK
jgi:outer membrane protein assembly factor BamD (BamD/ComL family)